MKEIQLIKRLYKPLQPAVSREDSAVSYQELNPDPFLQDFVYCYWQLKTTQALEYQYNYLVVSDACIDIFFNLDAPSESAVMGFSKEFAEFPLGKTFNYIGVRFFPSMFPQLFSINAEELSNSTFDLESVLPAAARFIKNRINPELCFQDIGEILDQFLLSQISAPVFDFDARFYNALQLILKHSGTLEVGLELDTGISPRQLRRIFNYFVGSTPKTFSKVVRFQHALKGQLSQGTPNYGASIYSSGYYDQAHFIKDFKKHYGISPSNAIR